MAQALPDAGSVSRLWEAYLASLGETVATTEKTFTAWPFCDNAADADQLLALVLRGIKRATAGSLAEFEAAGDPLPHVGELSLILDSAGVARCVIQTTRVDIVPFNEITAEFAATEGEGDRSLAYWRRVHWDYYTRVLGKAGLLPDENMLLAAERFDVVYSPDLADATSSWDVKASDWDTQVGEEGDPN